MKRRKNAMWSSEVTKGAGCHIHETVEFFGRCILGNDITIHAFTVVGGQPLSARLEKKPFPHYIPRVSKRPVIIKDKVVILNNTTIQTGVHIGRGSIIGNQCHLGHDSHVGEHCRVHVGSVTAGHVTLGDGVCLEPGAFIARGITVGAGSQIGAGSVVLGSVPPKQTYFGNPAKSREDQRKRSKLMRRLLLGGYRINANKLD